MLDVTRLRLLRAVVATGSIRASATMLGYTPSAVSQQLAALQRETGLRLFDRAGRGIEPTSAGQTLAAESEPLFEALSRVEALVGDLRAGRVGSLSIGYFGSAGEAWLPPVVAALHTEFPELRLDLRMTERQDTASADPDIDLFVEGAKGERGTPADVRRLASDPYLAVVPGDDPLAELPELPLADLAARRWVDNDLRNGPCRRILLAACAEAGFTPRFAVETHDYRTAMSFVATGVGITVIPRLGIGGLPAGLRSVPVVSPTPVRHIAVAVKKSIADHPAARRAVELLEAGISPRE
ncbi:DNA-binding transcriptional LysR family regulator [Prauserella shujinwangii]|uniref:DNA-binding transcriptional LysR family regulator n=1 Tax=Prauserella shujinwangii TaxID=1453103 RepID=A0A2T0LMN9_9PSEU|nr:LysR family transcriptional regulator [Prauserella shujinwangii]PRX44310.1 DNA-binding transcriptional LysR family regulator [Prauserella shujinwangii]